MAVGTPQGWCKVPYGTLQAMLTVARICLVQGPHFTARDSGLMEAWMATPWGPVAAAFHSGAYFDYKP